jgi:hypothetical protein
MARSKPERDLFGAADDASDGGERVELVMVYVDQTAKAWLLRQSGRPNSTQWAPKQLVTRADPPHQDVFAMPRWIARDRGWL